MSEQWNAMSPGAACDLIDYLVGSAWPMTVEEFQVRAVADLGWEVVMMRGKPYLRDTRSGLSMQDVAVMSLRDVVTRVWVPASDRAVDDTEQSRAFLGDAFALMVAEGARRWGAPEMSQTEKQQKATWTNPDGSRTEMVFSGRLCLAQYSTAAYMAAEHLHGSL